MRLTTRRLATLVLFLGLFSMALRVAVDSDTFGHLRSGSWMLDHGRVLSVDVFSHTMTGRPWVNPSWLSDVLMALTFRGLGYPGLNLWTALIACVAFGVAHRSAPGDAYLRAVAVALAAAACAYQFAAGPRIVSLLLTAIVAALLLRHRVAGERGLWLLPVVMVAWVNLASDFTLGLALVAITLAGETIQWALARRGASVDGLPDDEPSRAVRIFAPFSARDARGERLRRLGLTGMACVLAVGVNPYGWRVLDPALRDLSLGPARTAAHEPSGLSAVAFLTLWVTTLIVLAVPRPRRNVTDLLLFAALSVATLVAPRHVWVFAIVLTPILVRHAGAAWDAARAGRAASMGRASGGASGERARVGVIGAAVAVGASEPAPASPRLAWAVHVAVLGTVLVGVAFKSSLPLDPMLVERIIAAESPVGAADYLRRHPHPGALFNAYRFGGYLAWALAPETRVYVDGRRALYGDAFLSRYVDTYRAGTGWKRTLAEHAVGTVVVDPEAPIAQALLADPEWSLRYRDRVAVVLQRNL